MDNTHALCLRTLLHTTYTKVYFLQLFGANESKPITTFHAKIKTKMRCVHENTEDEHIRFGACTTQRDRESTSCRWETRHRNRDIMLVKGGRARDREQERRWRCARKGGRSQKIETLCVSGVCWNRLCVCERSALCRKKKQAAGTTTMFQQVTAAAAAAVQR